MKDKIQFIDEKINILLNTRDSEYIIKYADLNSWLCDTIAHFYHLESAIIGNFKINHFSKKFFIAQTAVNRHYREWGLDEVGDIYNEIRLIALEYMEVDSDESTT